MLGLLFELLLAKLRKIIMTITNGIKKRKNSRTKGAELELNVAKAFTEVLKQPFRRTPLSGGWAKNNAETAGDVVCTNKEYDFKWCVECKNAEGWNFESMFTDKHAWFDVWWNQTVGECGSKLPLLVFSRARQPVLCALKLIDFKNNLNPYMLSYMPHYIKNDMLILYFTDFLRLL